MPHLAPIIAGIGAATGLAGVGISAAQLGEHGPSAPGANILGPAGQGQLQPAPGMQAQQQQGPNLQDFLAHLQQTYNG